jgi:hypothetical protein
MANKEIKLEVGSKFRQAFSGNSGLEFEILSNKYDIAITFLYIITYFMKL